MPKVTTKKILLSRGSKLTFDEYKSVAEDIEKRLEPKFEAINSKFEAINSKFDAINSKFDAVATEIKALRDKIDSFKWVITIIITILVAMFAGIVGLFFK